MEIHILFAKISWLLLIVILIMRPLIEVTGDRNLGYLLRYRKNLGIASGIAALLHVGIFLVGMNLFTTYFTNGIFWSWHSYLGWGSFALVAMMFPLLTSNVFSQRRLRHWWKRVQKISYLVFIFTGVHIAMVKDEWLEAFIPIFIWAILWTWAEIKRAKRKRLNDEKWKEFYDNVT